MFRKVLLALDELTRARFGIRGRKQEEEEKGKISRWYFQGDAKDVRSGCHGEQFGSVIATKEQIEFLYVLYTCLCTSPCVCSPVKINPSRTVQSAEHFPSDESRNDPPARNHSSSSNELLLGSIPRYVIVLQLRGYLPNANFELFLVSERNDSPTIGAYRWTLKRTGVKIKQIKDYPDEEEGKEEEKEEGE